MITSSAQVSLADIPATMSSILGLKTEFDGRSIFEIAPQETRKRTFFYYVWQHINWQKDYFDHLDEFEVVGSANDQASWRHIRTYHSPESSYQANRITFGTVESGLYRQFGWGPNLTDVDSAYTYNWALGHSASVFLSLPKNVASRLIAQMKSQPFDGPQVITVKVDGREVGKWELSAPWNMESRSLIVPPDPDRPEVSVIEFSFSRCLAGKEDASSLAVLFESLAVLPAGK